MGALRCDTCGRVLADCNKGADECERYALARPCGETDPRPMRCEAALIRSPLGAYYNPADLPALARLRAEQLAAAGSDAVRYAHARTLADMAQALAAHLSPAYAAAPAVRLVPVSISYRRCADCDRWPEYCRC